MKLVAILGSRNPQGQTARATDALLEGAASVGWEVAHAFLPELQIERCRQCDEKGWGTCRAEGQCTIEDDFAAVADQIRAADAAVFATPVYFGDLSESMRAFTDRLRRVSRHEAGRAGIREKRAVGICVAGGGGGGGPSCSVSLEKVLRTCGFDVVDMIPARRQNLELKREVLRVTGRWLGEM